MYARVYRCISIYVSVQMYFVQVNATVQMYMYASVYRYYDAMVYRYMPECIDISQKLYRCMPVCTNVHPCMQVYRCMPVCTDVCKCVHIYWSVCVQIFVSVFRICWYMYVFRNIYMYLQEIVDSACRICLCV